MSNFLYFIFIYTKKPLSYGEKHGLLRTLSLIHDTNEPITKRKNEEFQNDSPFLSHRNNKSK